MKNGLIIDCSSHDKSSIIKEILFALTLVTCLFVFSTNGVSQNLKIYQIDVEQGDAALVITPSGKTLLIDCGKNGHGSRISDILSKEGKKVIDVFICTHYHEDHYGGIDDLVREHGITIKKVYDRGGELFLPESKRRDRDYLAYRKTVGDSALTMKSGQSLTLDKDVKITCVASCGTVINTPKHGSGYNENDSSIAIILSFRSFIYFNGGDIEKPTEEKIAVANIVKDVDVCKSDHHGAETSSDSIFISVLKPSVIIISNGSDARYDHPRVKTLKLYASLIPKPDVYQTNKYLENDPKGGNVPDRNIAEPLTNGKKGTILLLVDAKKKQFSLNYGGRKINYKIKE